MHGLVNAKWRVVGWQERPLSEGGRADLNGR